MSKPNRRRLQFSVQPTDFLNSPSVCQMLLLPPMLAGRPKLSVGLNRCPWSFIIFGLTSCSALSQFTSVPIRDPSLAVSVHTEQDFDLNASHGYAKLTFAAQSSRI
jgi:hypothetical protein